MKAFISKCREFGEKTSLPIFKVFLDPDGVVTHHLPYSKQALNHRATVVVSFSLENTIVDINSKNFYIHYFIFTLYRKLRFLVSRVINLKTTYDGSQSG